MFFTLKRLGLGLIFLGVALLAALYCLHLTVVNAILLSCFCIILIGVVVYVWGQKRESRY